MNPPSVMRKAFCRHCAQPIGDWHLTTCPTKKSGVDYRDVQRYEYRLVGPVDGLDDSYKLVTCNSTCNPTDGSAIVGDTNATETEA